MKTPFKLKLKQRATTVGVLLALAAIVGSVVVVSGIAPIKASSGHWAITKWFLQFSKDRSVATHSQSIKTPPLDDPAQLLRGAGHYETACANCHGSPLRSRSPLALASIPTPPLLADLVQQRQPRELFYVAKHGILFTGMPAWPAQNRDDEVWDVVAFLVQLPSMDRQEYVHLVFSESQFAQQESVTGVDLAVLNTCQRCHGADGIGRENGAFPHLAGQNQAYLQSALDAYASAERHSGMMQTVAAVLTKEEREAMAKYYAGLAAASSSNAHSLHPPNAETEAAIDRGRKIAAEGLPSKKVPSCADCHGPSAQPPSTRYPRLAGQPAEYLERQLHLFHNNQRGGGPAVSLMEPVAAGLPEKSFRDVALYYESLVPE